MKKLLFLITCLALMSLACLQTVMTTGAEQVGQESLAPAPTSFVKVEATVEFTLTPALALKGEGAAAQCAQVIASRALHLRQGAGENTLHLAYLQNGDVVRVLDQSDGDWWFVQQAGIDGYARSKYLAESECE